MRTFGIEEEFLLIGPHTGLPAVPRHHLHAALMARGTGSYRTHPELLSCQVESSTSVCTGRGQALEAVAAARRDLAATAADGGLAMLALGTPPQMDPVPAIVHHSDRYRGINEFCPGITAEHYICGTHVHVGINGPDEGVAALNALRTWLPLLTALGANSPYWRGADSGFCSWRTIQNRRWSVAGIPPHFTDAADYRQRMDVLLAADVVLDAGHISWGARLSARYPTVEIRVADVQLSATQTVVLALLIRALVAAGLRDPRPPAEPAPEAMDLAQWQAAKFGIRGNHIDLASNTTRSTEHWLRMLLEYVDVELSAAGDTDFVHTGLARLMDRGNGAVLQREFHRVGGFAAVLDGAANSLLA